MSRVWPGIIASTGRFHGKFARLAMHGCRSRSNSVWQATSCTRAALEQWHRRCSFSCTRSSWPRPRPALTLSRRNAGHQSSEAAAAATSPRTALKLTLLPSVQDPARRARSWRLRRRSCWRPRSARTAASTCCARGGWCACARARATGAGASWSACCTRPRAPKVAPARRPRPNMFRQRWWTGLEPPCARLL